MSVRIVVYVPDEKIKFLNENTSFSLEKYPSQGLLRIISDLQYKKLQETKTN